MVWYASYGSNLNKNRFLCYIEGGTPEGASYSYLGCRNKAHPKADKPIKMPFQLYFAKSSAVWDYGGVAFIDPEESKTSISLGRMYLITAEQFEDVIGQENGNRKFSIDLQIVKERGSLTLSSLCWYGHIIYLWDEENVPIFSITYYRNAKSEELNKPLPKYLMKLISGLKETHNLTDDNAAEYLISKPGVKGNYTKDDIIKIAGTV